LKRLVILTGIGLALGGGAAPYAQGAKPGQLNRSFGDDGWVRTRIVAHDQPRGVTIDSKHRIVAAGPAADQGLFGLARYRPSGRLDHSFSGNGKVTTRFSGGPGYVTNYVTSVAIDSQGRIVAAGSRCNLTAPPNEGGEKIGCEVAIARYLPNGNLDPSFDGDGQVTAALTNSDGADSVAIDSQDRIIVVSGNVVARFTENGTPDPSFGTGGQSTTGSADESLYAVSIDSQGRIVGVGYADRNGAPHFLVTRFLDNGDPDPSFGNGGQTIRPETGVANAVAINSKDEVMAAGQTFEPGLPGGFRLSFYTEDGTRARRWGDNGEVTTSFGHRNDAWAYSVAFDAKRIVAIGGKSGHQYALARYRRNGDLDRSFSRNGKASGTFTFPHRRHAGGVGAGVVDQRHRIVVAGGESHFLLARFIGH
jgi:uncharacterized delta-60 repeat protein